MFERCNSVAIERISSIYNIVIFCKSQNSWTTKLVVVPSSEGVFGEFLLFKEIVFISIDEIHYYSGDRRIGNFDVIKEMKWFS